MQRGTAGVAGARADMQSPWGSLSPCRHRGWQPGGWRPARRQGGRGGSEQNRGAGRAGERKSGEGEQSSSRGRAGQTAPSPGEGVGPEGAFARAASGRQPGWGRPSAAACWGKQWWVWVCGGSEGACVRARSNLCRAGGVGREAGNLQRANLLRAGEPGSGSERHTACTSPLH